jgi:hypothetical protein
VRAEGTHSGVVGMRAYPEPATQQIKRQHRMRQIYTSPRVENVDRVVAMLSEAGIETSVTNRRNWGGTDFKRHSYSARESADSWPQVWIVKAEDQPRARALMRDAGIEPAVRHAHELALARATRAPQRRGVMATYIRLVLLAAIAFIVLLRIYDVF